MTALIAQIKAFMEVPFLPFEKWDIPEEYRKAIKPYIKITSTKMYLPWPVAAAPRAGDVIYLTGLPSSMTGWSTIGTRYHYEESKGIQIFIEVGEVPPDYSNDSIEITDILHAAEEGFLLENELSIGDVLRAAGLASSRAEYQMQKP